MMNVFSGTKNPNLSRFSPTRTKGLATLDDLLKTATGKIPMGSWRGIPVPTGSEGVHFSPVKNIARGYDYSDLLRGTSAAKQTGKILEGKIPARFADLTRNMYGQIQGIMPADVANKAYFGKNVDLSALKSVAKPAGKFLGKAIPWAGAGIGAVDAAYRAKQGDLNCFNPFIPISFFKTTLWTVDTSIIN